MNRGLQVALRGYAAIRRRLHSLITRSPRLNRIVGDPLRVLVTRREWKVIAAALPSPLELDGSLFLHRPEDAYVVARLSMGAYEPEVRQCITNHLRAGDTFVDVGANLGCYTVLASKLVGPCGHVYAFEAAPSTADLLGKNVCLNACTNVTLVIKAVSNTAGRVRFYERKAAGESSILGGGGFKEAEVEAVTLDQFFRQEGGRAVRLLKIDIEGAESLALQGMREFSERNPALKMIVEVNLRTFTLEQLLDAAKACGFVRFHALELQRNLEIPGDIPLVLQAARRLTINLLCEM